MDGEQEAGREAEVVETPPSPLKDRLRDFRDSIGEQPDEDKPGKSASSDDDEAQDADADEGAGTEGDEQTEEQAEGDEGGEETADDAQDGDADDEGDGDEPKGKGRTFDVEIPTLNADGSKGPRGSGVLLLEGLPQEYRDTIISHVKRSQALEGVQQRLEEAREFETDARFFRNDPLNAMRLVAVERPELASKFVESWVVQNPKATKALIKALKIDEADEEKLELRGKIAAQTERDALAVAYNALDADGVKRDFITRAHEVVDEITGSLALDADEKADFEQLAGARIVAEQERRVRARQSPYLDKTELVAAIQSVVKKFTGAPPQKGRVKGKPGGTGGLSREQQGDRAKKVERFRQVRGGGSGSGVRPSGTKKSKMPRDMKERIALLRAGKL
jgi:hypothetical protein